nr:reverse transcriptase domain-containing protein [Tanacetum cinerariifolium]
MRTQSQFRHNSPQQEASPVIVEPLWIKLLFLEDQFQEDPPPEVLMADNQTMVELLQEPIEGYEDVIVIPKIAANNFELKHGLINLVQNKQFFGHDKEDPHAHIPRIWREKEPPRSILTWDDLVSIFINQFFPPSKMTNLHNEITRFQQRFDESFYEAWVHFNDLLRACPHHGFSELHQLDTFYNALNVNDQDSLNSVAGENFLDKMPRECLKIIESKSKVHQSRVKADVAKVSTSSSTPSISSEVAELKDMVRALLLDKKNQSSASTSSPTPAPVKAVEPNYVTCSGTHSYHNCPATSENVYRDNIQEYVSQAAAENYNQGNTSFRPQMVANQIRPPGFPPHQNNQNNFNRGNNFNQNRGGNFNQSNFNQGGNFNQGQLYRPQVNQPPAYQAHIPQTQKVSQTNFESYVKANDAILRNMQSQVSSNTASSSRSRTLLSNTITNPKEELKGITTRRRVSCQGPTNFNPSKVVKQGTEPVVAPVSAPMPNVKSYIPYPFRRDNERRRDQANEQIKKFYEIFKDISFEISFTDALNLMPKFTSTLKALIGNKEKLSEMTRTLMNEYCLAVILNKLPRKLGDPGKFLIPCEFPGMDESLALADLGASINLMPFSVWEALPLLKLTPTYMTLDLADCSVSKPIDIAKDVSFKVGVFHFPTDFVVVDFETDPRVPLILGRCFLENGRALIDVHKGELTLRIGNESITYNLDQTEVLGFSDVTASGNPTPHDDPIVSTTSPTLTPFGDSDFLLFEEADAFLGLEDDPNSPKINPFYYEPEGDILLLEAILNSKPLPPLPKYEQYLPSFKKELKGNNKLPVIIAKELGDEEKSTLIKVLKSHKRVIAWKLSDIQGINPKFYTHKILMEEDYKPAVQHQRRVNPKIYDVIKIEVEKLLDAGLIYPMSDSPWVSQVHYVPKKGGFTVVENEENELILTRLVTVWWVCIDYRKLDEATRKDHFPLPFMDQMLERLAGNEYYCFLDGFFGYFQIPIDPCNQEKTTFTCPYRTTAYRRMPFGLCNVSGMFQRCMLAIFHDMVEKTMEVFMDDFSIFGNSFENYLSRLDKMLQRAKVDVIAKLPHPTTVKDCIKAFQTLKKKLTKAPILIAPNWDLPFERMCDASDFAIGAVLGQRHEKHFRPIHYDSKMMNDVESNYNTTEKEMLAVVFGAPRAIISDRGTHFCNDQFAKVMLKYGVTHRLSTVYHHKLVGKLRYRIVALKQANFDLAVAGDHQKIQLNELNEIRDHAYENSLIYKEKTNRIHDSKIKNCVFNVDDRVLLFNSRLKIFSGKLKTRCSGPFTIARVFPYGTVELSQANGPNFKVNGHRVKHYFGGDVPQLVVPDLQTFPLDQ